MANLPEYPDTKCVVLLQPFGGNMNFSTFNGNINQAAVSNLDGTQCAPTGSR